MHAGWVGRTVVVTDPEDHAERAGAIVVSTPLDMILELESGPITRIVLANTASRRELASFLHETYPAVRVEEA